MRHTTWLQNRTPAKAINGKTPYEMKHKTKPYLGGIQEFGAAAYVKDLKAGKLDPRAQVGRFVGYDSKSKGYRIYWPGKRTVTVERNVVFNENDVCSTENPAIIHGDTLDEGERNKIIQQPPNNAEVAEKSEEENINESQTDENQLETHQKSQHKSSIPFPSTPEKKPEPVSETNEPTQEYGHGKHVEPKPRGTYKKMHGGLVAGIAHAKPQDDDLHNIPEGHDHLLTHLPPDFALVGTSNSEPRSFDDT